MDTNPKLLIADEEELPSALGLFWEDPPIKSLLPTSDWELAST
jgi:hypothetical protein